jgi:Secretion system C-terminal sorting domain
MKKSLSLFGLLFAAVAAFAQPYNVTLQVDMKNIPAADLANGVSVAGSFQSAVVGQAYTNWTPGQIMLTEMPAGSKKYSVTVQLPAGNYSFKFLKGIAWGTDESVAGACGGGDRTLAVTGNTVYPLNCFASCDACPSVVDTIHTRFLVDLTNKIALDGPPTMNGISIAGNFQAAVIGQSYSNWTPGQIMLTPVTAGSTIYQTPILEMPSGNYSYKFLYGNAWGTDENFTGPCVSGGNRSAAIAGANHSNLNVGPFCFATCDAVCPTIYPARPVKFTVDVSNTAGGTFALDGTIQPVAFTGTHIAMDDDGNGVTFSKTINIRPGDYQYRYYNIVGATTQEENFAPAGCVDVISGPVGDTRRTVTIPVGTTLYEIKVAGMNPFFNECFVGTENKQSAAFFTTAPNPFTTSTRISFANLENARFAITVYDVTGRAIKTVNNLTGNSAEITREGLTSGVFFATLTTENGARFTQKLIVE